MFTPKRILFEKNTLNYPMGKDIYDFFKSHKDVQIIELTNNRIKENIPGDHIYDFYRAGKQTLVVGIKRGKKFQTCKPSAHYQLPLLSGCIGQCEYCYLNTNLGDRPYMRVNVNLDDIYATATSYMDERLPDITIFEGSATCDPLPVEPYAHALKHTIEFFSNTDKGRFRFVSKYTDVDTLLEIDHKGHTEIRFTLNTNKVIGDYEKGTASLEKRIAAAKKVVSAGYPMGFIIAPVFLYDNWEADYEHLLLDLRQSLPQDLSYPLTFEVISHRYTTRAKNVILDVFPGTTLPMDDDLRTYKYGQFGYGKFVYTKEELGQIKDLFNHKITTIFPEAVIKYII